MRFEEWCWIRRARLTTSWGSSPITGGRVRDPDGRSVPARRRHYERLVRCRLLLLTGFVRPHTCLIEIRTEPDSARHEAHRGLARHFVGRGGVGHTGVHYILNIGCVIVSIATATAQFKLRGFFWSWHVVQVLVQRTGSFLKV